MGGKSYFCDYCRCYMKNDVKLRKTHNEGLAHTIMKVAIMRRYEGKLEKQFPSRVHRQFLSCY